jgi:hypothetical protein
VTNNGSECLPETTEDGMTQQEISTASISKILFYIGEYQAIQKANKCGSAIWNAASAKLEPLFAEMAKRQKAA